MVRKHSDAVTMEEFDVNQNIAQPKNCSTNNFSSVLSEQEALRRATLIKHRKVSTQFKLDMVQRQLSHLRRSVTDSESDRQFYRSQMTELSDELRDLGSTLHLVEHNAFHARRRILRQCGMDASLSSSCPGMYASQDNLSTRSSFKDRVCHLVSSPTAKFRKRHFFGELRAVASLSSLNVKSSSPTNGDSSPTKDSKSWKTPLRFLGSLVDSRIKRRFVRSSANRTQSADNVLRQDKSPVRSERFASAGDERALSSASSSTETSEDEMENWKMIREPPTSVHKVVSRSAAWKAPVARRISNNQRVEVDPMLLAEIEDFEKMAAQYVKQHS